MWKFQKENRELDFFRFNLLLCTTMLINPYIDGEVSIPLTDNSLNYTQIEK